MRITGGDSSDRKARIHPQGEPVQGPGTRTEGARKDTPAAADRIEISGEARGLHAAESDAGAASLDKTRAAAEPEPATVLLEEIRAKVKAGFYDTAEVTRSIADRMLDLLGVKRSK